MSGEAIALSAARSRASSQCLDLVQTFLRVPVSCRLCVPAVGQGLPVASDSFAASGTGAATLQSNPCSKLHNAIGAAAGRARRRFRRCAPSLRNSDSRQHAIEAPRRGITIHAAQEVRDREQVHLEARTAALPCSASPARLKIASAINGKQSSPPPQRLMIRSNRRGSYVRVYAVPVDRGVRAPFKSPSTPNQALRSLSVATRS